MDFHASSDLLSLPFTYWDLRESARNGYTLEDRRFFWPHVVTFPPKGRITVLEDAPAAAQRMYDRITRLSSVPSPASASALGGQHTQAQTQSQIQTQMLTSTDTKGTTSTHEEDDEDMKGGVAGGVAGAGGGVEGKAVLSDVRLSWKEDEGMVQQVMLAVSAHFPISQPGLLEPLVRHVVRVLDNTAMSFNFFCNYMEKSYWYSIPSLTAHRYKLNTFRELAKRCMKNTYALLLQMGALEEQHLNLIFVDRLAELLPEKFFYRVLDMYFIEGYKILYRFGLALLKVNKARIKGGEFKTGIEFWDSVKRDAKSAAFDFTPVFNFAFDNRHNNFFKISIVPGRARLQAFEVATRSVMTQEELTAPLHQELQSSVATHQHHMQAGVGSDNASALLHKSSQILEKSTAERLHSYLLPAAQMEGFSLMFSTYNDGWNLQTLYNKTQHLSPCIILIKTIGYSHSHSHGGGNGSDIDSGNGGGGSGGGGEGEAVLGMYMSSPVSPPSTSIRGDGLCFCFRLDSPSASAAQCHRWVGQTRDSVQALQATQLQFAICAVDYMAFGGSARYGTNALRLSSDLMTCESGESDTYCNPPLVAPSSSLGEGGQGGGSLKVGDVEVFCGMLSHVWR